MYVFVGALREIFIIFMRGKQFLINALNYNNNNIRIRVVLIFFYLHTQTCYTCTLYEPHADIDGAAAVLMQRK